MVVLVLQAVAPAVSEAGAGVQVVPARTVLTSRVELRAKVPMAPADCSAHAQSAIDAATLDSRACSVPASNTNRPHDNTKFINSFDSFS